MRHLNPKPYSRRLMEGALLFLVIITVMQVWIGPMSLTPRAGAQIPDAGKQRNEMVSAVQKTNSLLAQIIDRLDNSTLNVRMVGTDNNNDKAKPQRPKPARR